MKQMSDRGDKVLDAGSHIMPLWHEHYLVKKKDEMTIAVCTIKAMSAFMYLIDDKEAYVLSVAAIAAEAAWGMKLRARE